MPAMDRPGFAQTDLAWIILGYLSCCPDAKDTVEGIQQWWLGSLQAGIDAKTVRGALDDLVKAGWLVSTERCGTGIVYGLNADRRQELRHILPGARYGQEAGSVDSEPLED
jgi:hypothetical protein